MKISNFLLLTVGYPAVLLKSFYLFSRILVKEEDGPLSSAISWILVDLILRTFSVVYLLAVVFKSSSVLKNVHVLEIMLCSLIGIVFVFVLIVKAMLPFKNIELEQIDTVPVYALVSLVSSFTLHLVCLFTFLESS